ncbi:plant intracellular Ras-group-related LRR protein 5-like [Asterias rubens]|uniref:plant intracellular Ras-group-related LRR protein 5-like n=1 Tax=Asterias rubens TaxID=7604 RepID=UPI0014551AE0|nr:plant intracellular Ras-group-related LRR protein 5-like [Asterias rubens]XP_033634816.1 plant intracellular Ras-group-related LRR protein 5-like [Asterias rubens]
MPATGLKKTGQSSHRDDPSTEAVVHLKIKEARVHGCLILNQIKLQRLPSELVDKLNCLKHLYLSGCGLRGPLPSCLTRLHHLETLDISQNAINEIPQRICEELTRLITLDVSFNRVITLPKTISCLQSLEELTAAHNKIVVLPSCIGDLARLKVLDLTKNLLRDVPGEIFAGRMSCSLITLKLGGNLIRTLPAEAGLMHNLEELDLSENCCRYLPSTMRSLRKLKAFHHAGNDWMMCPPHIPGVPAKEQSSFGCKALEKLYSYVYPP